MKKYKLGFDIVGLIIFIIVMFPNFVWFANPAPNDVLRGESVTTHIDIIASIFQVLMIICLCVFIHEEKRKLRITPLIISMLICIFLYYASWIMYYTGMTGGIIIIGLTIPPCLVFLFYAFERKNLIAVGPIIIFMICHLIYGIVNFII